MSYYDILEIPKTATAKEIKSAYRRLATKYHPDKLPEDKKEWGTQKLKELNEADSVLSNPEKRKIYDQFGKEGLEGGMPGGMPNGFPGGFPGGFGGFPGMDNIFGQFMKKPKKEMAPIKVLVELTLEEIYNGKHVEQEINRFNVCKPCEGTGFSDKKNHECTLCNGKGKINRVMQLGPGVMQQMTSPCPNCNGTGSSLDASKHPVCKECNGTKIISEKFTINLDIPRGVHNEEVITIKDMGHEMPADMKNDKYTRGPVHVIISEKPHELFKRGISVNGNVDISNMLITIKLSLVESLCGFKKSITHLDGREIVIVETDQIKDGDIKCIIGEGMVSHKKYSAKGDLFVKYEVETTHLSFKQKSDIYNILTGLNYDDFDLSTTHDEHTVNTIPLNDYGTYKNSNKQHHFENHNEHEGNPVECRQM